MGATLSGLQQEQQSKISHLRGCLGVGITAEDELYADHCDRSGLSMYPRERAVLSSVVEEPLTLHRIDGF